MRIMIKGGVWKNTEDEILKAAVMKYGKNQWARISSLLVRKSAKQCKARWYEWLDPSIKKTEWTREEDEKLLHLAKLMPTQWRTIAPIVGRTPSQCLERYEKLLDAAYTKDDPYEPGDDPRKLRPGEIDPNPESKPARPDPVDMDEDEKEMLSEARARLANTRGKKAKRKAREKQLEEARRLASLQKRRELKAAGIDARKRKRKRRGIDYNAEIPFEKRPPPGFYDVAEEDRPVEQPKFPTTIEELEGERRVDKEARMRKQDIARNKIAQRQDAPSAVLQANKLNDPEAVRRRSKLNLPAPQISDQELEAISKIGMASDIMRSGELDEGSAASRVLLATYPQTPNQGMTPLRTPQRTPAGRHDAIMMEAENQRRLTLSQTPLLGGENPILHPSDFSGVTPKRKEIHTPNPLLTPSATPGASGLTPRIGMTPSQDGSFGMTPRGTPMRDELHINDDMEMLHVAKKQTPSFAKIPLPANEYKIAIPPIPEENEEQEEKAEEDMSDRLAREKAEEEERRKVLLRKRSKVLQRELPRPPASSVDLLQSSLIRADEDKSSFVPPTMIEQAENMIRKELLSLLEHDNAKYPLDEKVEKPKKGVKRKPVSVPIIEDFEENTLKEADYLIKEEADFLRQAMGHESDSLEEFTEAHHTCLNDIMYFPDRRDYGLSSVASNREKLSSLQVEFENVKKRMDEDTKKAARLEGKIKVITTGYQKRAADLLSQIEAVYKQMDTSGTELECFQALQKQEQLAASNRTNTLWEEVQKQKVLERTLQKRYGDHLAQKERIQHLLEEFRVQEEIAAKNLALEEAAKAEEVAAKNRALEEAAKADEVAAKNLALEEAAKADEVAAKNLALEEAAKADEFAVVNEPLETTDSVALADENMIDDTSLEQMPGPQMDATLESVNGSAKPDSMESNIGSVSPQIDATQENINGSSDLDMVEPHISLLEPQLGTTEENIDGSSKPDMMESDVGSLTSDAVSHEVPVSEKASLADLEPVAEKATLANKDPQAGDHAKPSDNEDDIRDTVDVQAAATNAEV